jgi:hypothetical protein
MISRNGEFKESVKRQIPKSAALVPYMSTKFLKFNEALKQALPSNFIAMPHVPIEKLFESSKQNELQMRGQYADFAVFSNSFMPILIIDLFDMSIVNLDTVNKVKNISKDVLRNSGIAVLDYKLKDTYNIDELRRTIANAMNPLKSV